MHVYEGHGDRFVNKGKCEESWRPTAQQELLLRAALLKGSEAVDAWKEWKSGIDIESLDPASHRMLPLLYRNLHIHGIKDSLIGKYKGVYRRTWYKNQVLFHSIASLLRSFAEAGIETMVLKGAALTALNYRDFGLRPMNDFDVLVHTEQALPAIKLLQSLGWEPVEFMPSEKYISVSYSHGFRNNAGQEFDLHWHVLSQSRETNADHDFWEGAITAGIHDVTTRALNPTDQLLHICIHGARWNYTPPFRWVADAMIVLATSPSEIDGDRLIAQARKRRLVLPLRDTLNYLRNVLNAPVPQDALRNIQGMPIPWIERIEYRVNVSQPTRWKAAIDLWCQHSRLTAKARLPHKVIGFPIFLQRIWGLDSVWKLPFYGLRKMTTRYVNRMTKIGPGRD